MNPAGLKTNIERPIAAILIVNTAAHTIGASVAGAEFDRLLKTRADLTLTACRAALPHLKKSPAGRIINMGFLRSTFAVNGEEPYARAERDLAALTRALAAECGSFGILANYVQPGAIMTPVSREVFRKHKELRDYCIASSAASRVGEPVDVVPPLAVTSTVVPAVTAPDESSINRTVRVPGSPW